MKVVICKLYNDEGYEDRVSRLVSKEKKLASNKTEVFCVDEKTQKTLEAAGIPSKIFEEFERADANDESTWEKVYDLSDGLHESINEDEDLKYSGINFITFEHNQAKYIYALRLTKLFKNMVEQGCEVLILVLLKDYCELFQDINSPNVKTIKFDNAVRSFIAGLYHRTVYQFSWFIKITFTSLKSYIGKSSSEKGGYIQNENRYKVLFVVRTPLYARPALSIYKQCLKDDLTPHIATDERTLIPLLTSNNANFFVKPLFVVSFISLLPKIGKALALFFRLRRHIKQFFDTTHPDAVTDEFSPEYLFREILLDNLPWLCYKAITDIIFLEKLINTVSPDMMCLMPQDHLFEQIASKLAKKNKNIPTLACSAAWETGTASSFRKHLRTDKLATSGEKIRKMYIESGLEQERVVVTGIAHFDDLFNRDKEHDRQILAKNGIDPDTKIIIYATDNIPIDESEEMIVGIINAISNIRNVMLVVKVHPRENPEPIQVIVDRYPNLKIQVFTDIDLYALLGICHLLITKGSTVALEAMMIGKPVVIIDLSGRPVAVPYVKEGAALAVYREEDIEKAIRKSLYDKDNRSRMKLEREKFVRNWAHKPDGRTSERIVTLMKEMIKTNK